MVMFRNDIIAQERLPAQYPPRVKPEPASTPVPSKTTPARFGIARMGAQYEGR